MMYYSGIVSNQRTSVVAGGGKRKTVKMKGEGILFIISAPSGAGKSTLFKLVLERLNDIKPSISYTTRPMRENEQNGVDYFFIPDEEFDNMIREDKFVEWANVHNYRYGTPKEIIRDQIASGEDLLFDIDVQGARSLKDEFPDSVLIYVLPPSFQVLKDRLLQRNTDSEDDITLRMENAIKEIEGIAIFDYLIINDDLNKALKDLESVISACRLSRQKNEFDYTMYINN